VWQPRLAIIAGVHLATAFLIVSAAAYAYVRRTGP
jgi:hypothetical protein